MSTFSQAGDGFAVAAILCFTLYMVSMFTLAIRGFILKLRSKSVGGASGEMKTHFLANRDFGAIVMFLNFVATYVGGIVMVWVPDFTKQLGYINLMWCTGASWCGIGFAIFMPRLREVLVSRDYISPNEFISDRYGSRTLTLLGSLAGVFQLSMIAGFEWLALKGVLSAFLCWVDEAGVEQCSLSPNTAVWLLGGFVLLCELLGGMSSVAISDAVQAGLLLVAFFSMPILCDYYYGGFIGVGEARCQNRATEYSFGRPPAFTYGTVATDACYDGNTTCGINLGGGLPDAWFPASIILQELRNENHTFGFEPIGEGAAPAGTSEVCCSRWNATVGICDGSNACPPPMTRYVSLQTYSSDAAFNVQSDHHAVGAAYAYAPMPVSAVPYGHNYSGYLQFLDGTIAFTTLRLTHSQGGCLAINANSFWHMKTTFEELSYLAISFGVGWIPFALSPITVHRFMTAKDASTLRTSVTWLVWFPFCFFVPVILIGVTAAAVFPTESTSTFPLVAFELAQRGVFPAACSVVLLTACMASFMSTADSIVIAIAAVVTMDMYKAIIMRGEASVKSLDRVKSLCSVATIAITIGVALYADVNFLSMLNIGNGFLTINMLIFLGLFFPSLRGVHVFLGSIVVFILTVSFEAKRQSFGEDGPPLPPPFGAGLAEDKYLWLLPPFWTVVLGPTATFLAWAGMRYTGLEARFQCWWKTSFDAMSSSELAQFGEISLSEDEHGTIIQNIMQHVQEPVTTKKAWPFIFAIPLICTLAIPWDYDERMQLAGQQVVFGMPSWAFNMFILSALPPICATIAYRFWKTEHAAPGRAVDEAIGLTRDSQAPQFNDKTRTLSVKDRSRRASELTRAHTDSVRSARASFSEKQQNAGAGLASQDGASRPSTFGPPGSRVATQLSVERL